MSRLQQKIRRQAAVGADWVHVLSSRVDSWLGSAFGCVEEGFVRETVLDVMICR